MKRKWKTVVGSQWSVVSCLMIVEMSD